MLLRRPKPKPIDYSTRVCLTQQKFTAKLNVPSKQALDHLKMLIQLHNGEFNAYKEQLEEQKSNNFALIKQLRSEIMAKRVAALCPGRNEMLLRSSLKDHHDGSKIFEESEPRDVNDQADFQTSDLQNKLNSVKHTLRTKKDLLSSKLVVFNDTVEDVAFLELEGPVGDERCLALENHIGDVGKKILEAETLQRTLKHIRDQLVVERLTNNTSIETMIALLKGSQEELNALQESLEDSQQKRTNAVVNSLKTEVDSHGQRKDRTHKMAHYKKLADEQKQDLLYLRKIIQAFFMFHESVPLRNSISDQHREDDQDFGDSFTLSEMQDMELDTSMLREATGSHSIHGVVECFETQRDTFLHLRSLVKEMEVKKACLLRRLKQLSVQQSVAVFHDQDTADGALQQATEQRRAHHRTVAKNSWSVLAATNRVTQVLARLRQLLEYLVTSLAQASLVPAPPQAVSRLETGPHLKEMLRLASGGVKQLMERLGDEEPDEVLQRAARLNFALTRSEEKVTTRPPPTLGRIEASEDGDTTGDDVRMATRISMKRQAQLIVQAKLKAGYRKKKW